MWFEGFVALRYLRGKRKNRFINLITIISIAGVAVGVITLIIVLAVMTGFQMALRETIIGNRAHISILRGQGLVFEGDYRAVMREIEEAAPEIQASGPFIQVQALLEARSGGGKVGRTTTGAYIIGVDPGLESNVTQLAQNLTLTEGRTYGAGALPGEKEIVLGYVLANSLGVNIGDKVAVYTPKDKPSPFGTQRAQQLVLTVSGISQAKMSEFDTVFAWVDIPTAEMLTGNTGVDGIHVRLPDPFMAEEVARRVEHLLGYRSITWYENQMAFFEALRQEKLAMFIILVFIVLVAAFNISSTLMMMVMEKQRDIGILRTIGVSAGSILRLFVAEGLIIGLSGTFLGVILGTILAYNLNPVAEFLAMIFNIKLFDSQIYYFDRIPTKVVPGDVFRITIAAIILTFVSTIYPAWSAARLNPVDALRHE
jgi:lipoprotein-releasing system permease protein